MSREYHIVYVFDDNYWMPTLVSAMSALMRLDDSGQIVFDMIVANVLVEHRRLICSFLETNKSRVCFVEFDAALFQELPAYHGTKMSWARCFLPTLLPDAKGWVCICDGDTLWFKGPQEIFREAGSLPTEIVIYGSFDNPDTRDYSDPWFVERGLYLPQNMSFCMGFLLADLDKLRETDVQGKTLDFVRKYGAPHLLEQDILNYLYLTRKALMPKPWGAFPKSNLYMVDPTELGLVHFAAELPWKCRLGDGLSDIEMLWWFLAEDLMGVVHQAPKFWTNMVKRLLVYLFTKCVRIIPSRLRGPLRRVPTGVSLPYLRMRCEMKRLYLKTHGT